MIIYLSGPMTGYKDFNIPAFDAVDKKLSDKGHRVFSPADVARWYPDKDWGFYMRRDIARLMDANAVVVLPNWNQSKGASLEVQIARTLGIPVYNNEEMRERI